MSVFRSSSCLSCTSSCTRAFPTVGQTQISPLPLSALCSLAKQREVTEDGEDPEPCGLTQTRSSSVVQLAVIKPADADTERESGENQHSRQEVHPL